MKKILFILAIVLCLAVLTNAQVSKKISGHTGYVNTVAFSPGGKFISSGSNDGTIRIISTDEGKLLKEIKTDNSIFKLVFSEGAKEICAGITPLLSISAAVDSFIVVYDAFSGLLNKKLDVKSRSPNFFYSEQDKTLMTIVPDLTADSCTYTYDYTLSRNSSSNCYKLMLNNYNLPENNYKSNYVNRIHFWSFNSPWTLSHNGKYIAVCPVNEENEKNSATRDKNIDKQYNESMKGSLVYFFDIESRRLVNKVKIINSYLRQKNIIISDDSKYFYYTAVEYFNDVIKILDINKDEEIKTLKGHTREILSIALHPSGKYLASAGKDNTVRIWDLRTGETIRVLEGHTDNVNYVAFSPNGKYLVSASDDKAIILWDLSLISSDIDLYSMKYDLDKGIKDYLSEERNMEENISGNSADIKSLDEKYSEKYNDLYKKKSEEYNNRIK
jgi:WD40 repeat protein